MKSYDEIDHWNEEPNWWEFIATILGILIFSIWFAWVFIYLIPWIGTLVIR